MNDLLIMDLGQLQAIASRVGVGFTGLGHQALLDKLIMEGAVR